MTLTDTGPLVALVNRNDPNHAVCVEAAKHLPYAPLCTTWPCFTEAMYLVFRAGGYPAQAALWEFVTSGRLLIFDLTAEEAARMADLMDQYRDRPMDLADASLLAVADSRRHRKLFTLDSDFRIYRLKDVSTLELVP